MSNKYEQLVEFIINDETDKARELFHKIVVEKSRDIYENLVAEEDLDEVGGNQVEDMINDVQMDEEGISEEESDEADEDMMNDMEDHDGEEASEEHGEEEIEDRVMDLESALDELKAEFDALMAGEEHEEEMEPGIHGDDEGDVEMEMMNTMEEQSEFFEAKDDEDEDKDDEDDKEDDLDETIVREYVEKVATPANSEGSTVGTGKSVAVNKKSTVAGKNDMGGVAAFTKGGNTNPDGTSPNASVKPKGDLIGKVNNTPGASAGKTAFKTKEASTGAEGKLAGADGSRPINKDSVIKTTPR